MKHFSRLFLLMVLSWHGVTHVTEVVSATLSTPADDIAGLNISVNEDGQAIAIWSRDDAGAKKIQAAFFDGTMWGTAVDVGGGADGIAPWVSFNNEGKAVAVWQDSLTGGNILANTFVLTSSTAGSWQSSASIIATGTFENDGTYPTSRPRVGLDATGNALATWMEVNDTTTPTEYYVYVANSLDLSGSSTDIAMTWTTVLVNEDLVDQKIFMDPNSNIFQVYGKDGAVGLALISWIRENDGAYVTRASTNDIVSAVPGSTKYTQQSLGNSGSSSSISLNARGDFFASTITSQQSVTRDLVLRDSTEVTECNSLAQSDILYSLWVNISDNRVLHEALAFNQIGTQPFDDGPGYRIAVLSGSTVTCVPFPEPTLDIDLSTTLIRLNPMVCSYDNENAILIWNSQGSTAVESRIGVMQYSGSGGTWNTDSIQYINANLKKVSSVTNDLPFYLDCPRTAKNGQHYAGLVWWDDDAKTVRSLFATGTCTPLAPSPVSQLNGSADLSNGYIQLTWNLSPDTDIVSQRVFRSNGVTDFMDVSGALGDTVTTFTDANVNLQETYTYFVRVENSAGLISDSSAINVGYFSAPSAPLAVSTQCVINNGSLAVNVTWVPGGTESLSGYNIYRVIDGQSPQKVNTDVITTLSYQDVSAQFSVVYTYYVTAVNTSGVESAPSKLTVTIPCSSASPPPAPTQLNAECLSSTSVLLNWMPADSDLIDEQRVFRDGLFLAGGLANTAFSYVDMPITSSQEYEYAVVSAVGDNNLSSPARTSIICTGTTIPDEPMGVYAACIGGDVPAIQVTWAPTTTAIADGITTYRIYRNGTSDPIAEVDVTDNNGEGYAYTDSDITLGVEYYYSVSAYDADDDAESNKIASAPVTCQEGGPDPVRNLSATCDTTNNRIQLTWTTVTENCTYLQIYKLTVDTASGDITGPELIGSPGCATSIWNDYDVTLTSTLQYTYEVRSCNDTACTFSKPITIKPQDCGIEPVSNETIEAILNDNGQLVVNINWTVSPTVGITEYNIYRDNRLIGTVGSGVTSFEDLGVSPGVIYAYSIGAVTAGGEVRSRTRSVGAGNTFPQPSRLRGTCTFNQFALESEYYKTITWTYVTGSSTSLAGMTGQEVYRNGVRIATLSPSALQYVDHDRPAGVAETYYVVPVGVGAVDGSTARQTVTVTC